MSRFLPAMFGIVGVVYAALGIINQLDESPAGQRVRGVDAVASVVMLAIAAGLALRRPPVGQVQSWIAALTALVIATGSYGLFRNPLPGDTGTLELASLVAGMLLTRKGTYAALCALSFAGLLAAIALDPSGQSWNGAIARLVGFTGAGWILHFVRERQSARIEALRQENLARAAALDASEERFRTLAENARDLVSVVDDAYRFVYVSPRSREMLGYEPEELLGHGPGLVVDWKDQRKAMEVAPQWWSGSSGIVSMRCRTKDGETVWHEIAARPIEIAPGRRALVLISRDVTERIALEERLREALKHESLTVMAGGIAHDFNNLLAIVLGEAELARDANSRGRDVGSALDQIAAAAERAQRLTGQLLAYAGGMPREERVLDLAAQVKDVIDLLRSSVPSHTELRFELDATPPAVRADPGQLQQLVMNLVLNAAQSRDGAPVRISVSVRRESQVDDRGFALAPAATADAWAVLEVADDGAGIAREHFDRIFDPFFTTKRTGHGLGLAAVLGVARSHGAGIRVVSQPDAGSRFQVFFPAHGDVSAFALDRSPRDGARRHPAGRALVVDDEAAVRGVMARSLLRLGFETFEAESGEEGLAIAERHADALRLAVVDVSMGGIDGLETRRRLRALRPDLPVLLMTGFDRPGALTPDDEPEASFLRKPFTQAQLAQRVRELLDART